MRIPAMLATAVLAATACGGGGDSVAPPPPPPPLGVATVEVAPSSPSVIQGDTLRLTATAKTASGTVLSGKTASWSSSNAAVATVSSLGTVTGVTPGNATITATVEGKTGSAQVKVERGAPLDLESSRAVNDSIGPAGGVLTATGSNGITYTLSVPANALLTRRRITMTPVRVIRTVPLSGVLGAVDLQPSGLRFARPARLRIGASTAPPGGMRLLGFSYEAQGDSVAPAITADSGSSVTVLLNHFSGGGAGFGTSAQIRSFVTTSASNLATSQTYINALLAAQNPLDIQAEDQAMRDWMNNVILPFIQAASNDLSLSVGVSEYNFWRQMPLSFGATGATEPVLAPERDAANAALAPKLREAIIGNNQLCQQQRDLTAASNVLFWQTQAAGYGLDTPAEQLDRGSVLANLCIQVVITKSDYPIPAVDGQVGTLDGRAGLKFGSDPNLDLQPFSWQVDLTGSTSDGRKQGLADALGEFFLNVTPTGQTALNMLITMCLFNPLVPYSDVCSSANVIRPFGPLQVTTSTMPQATQGQVYATSVGASGGNGIYQWTVISGFLPAGLALSSAGLLSGTPTVSGNFTFTVRVTSGNQSVIANVNITVGGNQWQLRVFIQCGNFSNSFTASIPSNQSGGFNTSFSAPVGTGNCFSAGQIIMRGTFQATATVVNGQ
ncbi:MAG TPA: Ig-like domain-containing protein, partial [Gemmatimonadales bacterium]|nr:Ig-like domain-containing protein [Gemmatimonadales bacterium]